MKTYRINSELGPMSIEAENVDDAKSKYSAGTEYDFDAWNEYPGSWYWIDEDGVRVESHCENMP